VDVSGEHRSIIGDWDLSRHPSHVLPLSGASVRIRMAVGTGVRTCRIPLDRVTELPLKLG